MKRENLVFLLVGFAFGALFGVALLNAFRSEPDTLANASQSASPLGPSGPMAPTQVGNPAQNPGQGDGAPMMAEIRALRKRIDDDPNDLAALVRLANLHQDISDFQNAIGYYERALAIEPDNSDRITDMGICYRGLGEFDRALELFREANQKNPGHWQSLFNIVVVAGFDKGDYDSAFAALETLERDQSQLPQLGDLRSALEKARTDSGG